MYDLERIPDIGTLLPCQTPAMDCHLDTTEACSHESVHRATHRISHLRRINDKGKEVVGATDRVHKPLIKYLRHCLVQSLTTGLEPSVTKDVPTSPTLISPALGDPLNFILFFFCQVRTSGREACV
jgi:hypothetical protein